jgi:hypothetical protein
MVEQERRAAARFKLPEGVGGSVGGVSVRIVDMSLIGARLEHDQRFPLENPQLRIQWQGRTINVPFRAVRSEIVGRRDSGLIYQTGIQLDAADAHTQGVIASILRASQEGEMQAPAQPAPPTEVSRVQSANPLAPAATKPAHPPAEKIDSPLEDTWTRGLKFLKSDLDEDLPYAQFRLTERGWTKDYVASPEQPEDGFTIRRDQTDFAELQRTYEYADSDTRRMIRIALESQLR